MLVMAFAVLVQGVLVLQCWYRLLLVLAVGVLVQVGAGAGYCSASTGCCWFWLLQCWCRLLLVLAVSVLGQVGAVAGHAVLEQVGAGHCGAGACDFC